MGLYKQFLGKATWKSIHLSLIIDKMHSKAVKGEQGTNGMPLSKRRLCCIPFFTASIVEIEIEMAQS